MLWFDRQKMRAFVDSERVEAAIAEAERRTSGEIRVSIAPWFWGNVERAAARAFERLGMGRTRERNGVLFFVVPSRRAFVVLGDEGIHARVGQDFWVDVSRELSEHFRRGEFTAGLLAGIVASAERLERHFPRQEADLNELPDALDRNDSPGST
jgi:uncharacterized membrane protein